MTRPQTPQEFRAFVRRNHPDVGGDPEVFAAGVAAYRARASPGTPPRTVFYRKPSLLVLLLQALRPRRPVGRRAPRTHDRRVR